MVPPSSTSAAASSSSLSSQHTLLEMLELEVVPEHGLCSDQVELLLGMHFSQAVAVVQSLVGTVRGVHVLYSDLDPLGVDLVLDLTNDGVRLVFDPVSQRLKTIEVHDLSLVRLKYSDVLFNCAEVSPTLEQIDQSFGATHPGVYDGDKQVFTLTFRGLSFEFPAESKFQPSYDGLRQKLGRLQFPPGQSPLVSRLHLYRGQSLADCMAPPAPTPRSPTLTSEGVEVLRSNRNSSSTTLGLRVRVLSVPETSPSSSVGNVREIRFGDSAQDVATALGAPQRVFFKSEDKMKIHLPSAHRAAAARKSDYFYNYFTLGFDVLFDARTNTAKKFVLHTNFPGHYNFNMYHRCQFELPLYPDNNNSNNSQLQQQHNNPQQYHRNREPFVVTAFARWEEVSAKVKPCDRPVVLNRASSTNTTNPFGSTFCYGYQDIIFEVMPNGQLGSVTLWRRAKTNSVITANHGDEEEEEDMREDS